MWNAKEKACPISKKWQNSYHPLLRTNNCKQGLGCVHITPDVTRQCFLVGTWGRGRKGWKDAGWEGITAGRINTWINNSERQIQPSHQSDLAELHCLLVHSQLGNSRKLGLVDQKTHQKRWIYLEVGGQMHVADVSIQISLSPQCWSVVRKKLVCVLVFVRVCVCVYICKCRSGRKIEKKKQEKLHLLIAPKKREREKKLYHVKKNGV